MSKKPRRITKTDEVRSPPPVEIPVLPTVVWTGPVMEETEVSHWRVWSMGDTHRAIESISKFADKEVRFGASNGKGIVLNPDCGSLRNAMQICELHHCNKNLLDTNLLVSNKDAILAEYENEKIRKKGAPAIAPNPTPVYDSGEKSVSNTETKRKAKMKVNLKVAYNLLTNCNFKAQLEKSKASPTCSPGSKGEAKILDYLTKFHALTTAEELDTLELSEAQRELAKKLLKLKKGEEIEFIRKDEDTTLPPEPEKKSTGKKEAKKPAKDEDDEPKEASKKKTPGKRSKKEGVVNFAKELLLKATSKKPISKADMLAKATEKFPDRDPDKMKVTLGNAFNAHWWKWRNWACVIEKNDKGSWMIAK